MNNQNCRHCRSSIDQPFLDLGHVAPSNAYLTQEDLSRPEVTFPLRVHACLACGLVQTEDYAEADALFTEEYAYFSSTSKGWLAHAAVYAKEMINRFSLTSESHVIEVASNDGYLLKNFVERDIPCLGIEPTASTAAAAQAIGVPTWCEFFGVELAKRLAQKGQQADLIAGNNVFAHVPDINDFTAGLALALKPQGVLTLEFPHLLEMIEVGQFDTVYHEHFSYLSLTAVSSIFAKAGLRVFDVEKLTTHGGSLRVFGCLAEASHLETSSVSAVLQAERDCGLHTAKPYADFQARAEETKNNLVRFLLDCKDQNKTVAAYGAAAKGNTILNFGGIRSDLIPFVCDAALAKQGKYLPGSHIPILAPDMLEDVRPDIVLVLPWNIAKEVKAQLSPLLPDETEFWCAVPEMSQL